MFLTDVCCLLRSLETGPEQSPLRLDGAERTYVCAFLLLTTVTRKTYRRMRSHILRDHGLQSLNLIHSLHTHDIAFRSHLPKRLKTPKKLTGSKIGAIFWQITSRVTTKNLKIGQRGLFELGPFFSLFSFTTNMAFSSLSVRALPVPETKIKDHFSIETYP